MHFLVLKSWKPILNWLPSKWISHLPVPEKPPGLASARGNNTTECELLIPARGGGKHIVSLCSCVPHVHMSLHLSDPAVFPSRFFFQQQWRETNGKSRPEHPLNVKIYYSPAFMIVFFTVSHSTRLAFMMIFIFWKWHLLRLYIFID